MLSSNAWDSFGKLVEEAKERENMGEVHDPPTVIVDFGELSYVHHDDMKSTSDSKGDAIRRALAISNEDDLWCMSFVGYFSCFANDLYIYIPLDTRSRISSSIVSSGYFVVSARFIGFWTKSFSATDQIYRYPISTVLSARQNYSYLPRTFGMALELKDHRPAYFNFPSQAVRDKAIRRVTRAITAYQLRVKHSIAKSSPILRGSAPSSPLSATYPQPVDASTRSETIVLSAAATAIEAATNVAVAPSTGRKATRQLAPLGHTIGTAAQRLVPVDALPLLPKVINLPRSTLPRLASETRRIKHVVCLTIGSRGDVQPYIALAKGLQQAGHEVTIVTHEEYKEWVEGWGIKHRTAGGDPGALMKLSVEHKVRIDF